MTQPIADIGPIDTEFEDNTNQRTPCILVLDASGSMNDDGKIDKLNQGLRVFEEELKKDKVARMRVQVLVIRLGGQDDVEVLSPWTDARNFTAPALQANGTTPLGEACDLALAQLQMQKDRYRDNGIAYTRPWLFLMTDGEPTDRDWMGAAQRLCQAATERKALVWAVAIGEGPEDKLRQFTANDRVYRLDAAQFREMFVWLSASMSAVSQSKPGEQVQIAMPTMMIEA